MWVRHRRCAGRERVRAVSGRERFGRNGGLFISELKSKIYSC